MPAVRSYDVVQERKVTVTAESPSEAIQLAKQEFDADGGDNDNPKVRETDIRAGESF